MTIQIEATKANNCNLTEENALKIGFTLLHDAELSVKLFSTVLSSVAYNAEDESEELDESDNGEEEEDEYDFIKRYEIFRTFSPEILSNVPEEYVESYKRALVSFCIAKTKYPKSTSPEVCYKHFYYNIDFIQNKIIEHKDNDILRKHFQKLLVYHNKRHIV